MKRDVIFYGLWSILFALSVSLFFKSRYPHTVGIEIGYVESTQGITERQIPPLSVWSELRSGDKLAKGSFVWTGNQSRTRIVLRDGRNLDLEENTLVMVTEGKESKSQSDNFLVSLVRGSVEVSPPPDSVQPKRLEIVKGKAQKNAKLKEQAMLVESNGRYLISITEDEKATIKPLSGVTRVKDLSESHLSRDDARNPSNPEKTEQHRISLAQPTPSKDFSRELSLLREARRSRIQEGRILWHFFHTEVPSFEILFTIPKHQLNLAESSLELLIKKKDGTPLQKLKAYQKDPFTIGAQITIGSDFRDQLRMSTQRKEMITEVDTCLTLSHLSEKIFQCVSPEQTLTIASVEDALELGWKLEVSALDSPPMQQSFYSSANNPLFFVTFPPGERSKGLNTIAALSHTHGLHFSPVQKEETHFFVGPDLKPGVRLHMPNAVQPHMPLLRSLGRQTGSAALFEGTSTGLLIPSASRFPVLKDSQRSLYLYNGEEILSLKAAYLQDYPQIISLFKSEPSLLSLLPLQLLWRQELR